MSTSGIYSFNETRNEIIKDALILLNVVSIDDDAIPDAYQAYSIRTLNRMIKAWQAEGLNLWNRKEGTVFFALNQHKYSLGPTGDHATASYLRTTLSATAAAAATSITLSATDSNLAINGNIGIILDSGALFWTTISNIVGSTITLNSGLTSGATSGNIVFGYVNKIQRPMRILAARRMDSTYNEMPMTQLLHEEYMQFTNKMIDSFPQSYYYDKQLTNGVLWVYPEPSDVTQVMNITYHEPIEDFNSATDNADFPVEWLDPLIYNLAANMVPVFGMEPKAQELQAKADLAKSIAQNFDSEEANLIISPSTWQRGRGYR